jgi:hypothetical protein
VTIEVKGKSKCQLIYCKVEIEIRGRDKIFNGGKKHNVKREGKILRRLGKD